MWKRISFLVLLFSVVAFYGVYTEVAVWREIAAQPSHEASFVSTVYGAGAVPLVSKQLITPTSSILRDFRYDDLVSSEEDSVAIYADPQNPDDSLLLTTHKSANQVKIWSVKSGKILYVLSGFKIPNGIVVDQLEGSFYVTDRLNYALKKFFISDIRAGVLSPRSSIIAASNWKSKEPMGITLYRDNSTVTVYATFIGSTPKYVRGFNSTLTAMTVEWPVSGASLESILADDEHRRLYVADESNNRVLVFGTNGSPYSPSTFGSQVFLSTSDPEGLDLYECGEDGYIIVSDQKTKPYTEFEIFDRLTFSSLAKFSVNDGSDTDGITISQSALPNYPYGGFFVQSRDKFFEGVRFERISSLTGMPICMNEGLPLSTSTADSVPPSVPQSVLATPISQSMIDIQWSASTDNVAVAGYALHRNGSLLATTTALLYHDSDLLPLSQYTYEVSAFDTSANSSGFSSSTSATTLSPDVQPPVISNVTSSYTTMTSTVILWNTDELSDSYVSYGTTSGYGLSVSNSAYTTAHTLSISSLTPDTVYYYQVRSRDGVNNESVSQEYSFSTLADATPPKTTANPRSSSFTTSIAVSLSTSESAVTYYTTDGSLPTSASPRYAGMLTFTTTTELSFYSVDVYGNTESVQHEVYTFSGAPTSVVNKVLTVPSAPLLKDFHYEDGVSNEEDSVAIYVDTQSPDDSLLFTSHKNGNVVKMWNVKTGFIVSTLTGFSTPNGLTVDQGGAALYVTDRDNFTVKKYLISDLRSGILTPSAVYTSPTTWKSREPMGIDIYYGAQGTEVFVTYIGSSSKYVRVFDPGLSALVREWTVGSATLESISADSDNNLIYVADESTNVVFVYTPFGVPHSPSSFGQNVFLDDPEGIAIYACGTDGYIIVSDQKVQPYSEYKIFDRKNFSYIGRFSINDGQDTDGIAVTQLSMPNYPKGAFIAQSRDRFFEGLRFERIATATGMTLCMKGE